jgi:hypothetical protein
MFRPTKDYAAFRLAMGKTPGKVNLTDHTDEEYDKGEVYLSDDGLTGIAMINGDESVNLFNNSGSPNAAFMALQLILLRGARRCDCFDGKLVKLYQHFGFVEVRRVKFDDAYAPDGWDYDKLGRPDIVYMELEPNQ